MGGRPGNVPNCDWEQRRRKIRSMSYGRLLAFSTEAEEPTPLSGSSVITTRVGDVVFDTKGPSSRPSTGPKRRNPDEGNCFGADSPMSRGELSLQSEPILRSPGASYERRLVETGPVIGTDSSMGEEELSSDATSSGERRQAKWYESMNYSFDAHCP